MNLLCVLLAASASAKTNKVAHKAEVDPATRATVPVEVGSVTHMDRAGDVLYVAGTRGIAAVAADGTVEWTLELPDAAMRNVDADGASVAFTSYRIAGIDPAEGLKKFVMGGLGDNPTFEDATIGLVNADGTLAWSIPSDLQAPLSAPGLSPSSVGIMRGKDLLAVSRADGSELGRSEMNFLGDDSKFFAGFFAQATRGQPVVMGEHFYASFIGFLLQTDLQGNQVGREAMAGLTPYSDITCGPTVFRDDVAFGSSGDSQVKSFFFGVDERLKTSFKEASPDDQSGCGSITSNGDHLFMASNFYVVAFNDKGKVAWEARNKKGGLYPSSNRGVRYVHSFGVRKSYGDLMVADDRQVYVATDNGGDVVTVLDAATGAYLRTISVKTPIVAMALVGEDLAIATPGDVRFVSTAP